MRLSKKIISFAIASCMALSAVVSTSATTTGIEKGLKLSVESVEGNTAVITVEAVGYDEVTDAVITLTTNETFVDSNGDMSVSLESTLSNDGGFVDVDTNEAGFSLYTSAVKGQDTSANPVLGKITLVFAGPITSATQIMLSGDSAEANAINGEAVPNFTLDVIETVAEVTPAITVSGNDTPFLAGYDKSMDDTITVESVADIFKVLVEANEYTTGSITGLDITVNGNTKRSNTALAAGSNVTLAVIVGYVGSTSAGYTPEVTAVIE